MAMAATKVLLDTGPLIAYLNRKDQYHAWATDCWSALNDPLWICESVLSEAVFSLQSERVDPDPILRMFERGIIRLEFEMEAHRADVFRLLRKYADQPMSLADACLVRMTETHADSLILTTDADFGVYRRHGRQVVPCRRPD